MTNSKPAVSPSGEVGDDTRDTVERAIRLLHKLAAWHTGSQLYATTANDLNRGAIESTGDVTAADLEAELPKLDKALGFCVNALFDTQRELAELLFDRRQQPIISGLYDEPLVWPKDPSRGWEPRPYNSYCEAVLRLSGHATNAIHDQTPADAVAFPDDFLIEDLEKRLEKEQDRIEDMVAEQLDGNTTPPPTAVTPAIDVAELAKQMAAHLKPESRPPSTTDDKPPEQVDDESRALAILHSQFKNTRRVLTWENLSKATGISRSKLCEMKGLKAAKNMMAKDPQSGTVRKGYATADGGIEAIVEDDEIDLD